MADPVTTFRMSARARLFFDVTATTEAEAREKAARLCDRLEDGAEVENVDLEDELVDAVVYLDEKPVQINGDDVRYDLDVLEEREADEEDEG
jgi:hypothetical protein